MTLLEEHQKLLVRSTGRRALCNAWCSGSCGKEMKHLPTSLSAKITKH